ncbi:class I SAM-dependent methyltransferase [uncultured Roseibium sp.]|uniref:class I SAM-dependent methyltransferase n=1 Tax=uncultured Roseibium sp. TaxID=1936171 RepID=UPI0026140321|nr:class I SAM-dependent methyltransferase [uncultured Roseibium sp.]
MSIIDRCLELYRGENYYVTYPARPLPQDYWDVKKDPDGKVRDAASERDTRKEDVRYIADYINRRAPGTVLDIGFGLGELLEQVEDLNNCFGLDPSARAVEIGRERCSAQLKQGVLEPGTFAKNSFDVVVANHVIEHVDEPVPFVETVFDILKPGGDFICGTPNFASAAARVFQDRFRLLHDPTHVSLFTDDSLIRLFRDKGFRIEQVDYPFFGTRFASPEAFETMVRAKADVSPAFWGSFVTVFARKPE